MEASATPLFAVFGTSLASDVVARITYVLDRSSRRDELAQIAKAALGIPPFFGYSHEARIADLAATLDRPPRDLLLREYDALDSLARVLVNLKRDASSNGGSPTHKVDFSLQRARKETIRRPAAPTISVHTYVPCTVNVETSAHSGRLTVRGDSQLSILITIDKAPPASYERLAIERDATGHFSIMHDLDASCIFPILSWADPAKLRDVAIRLGGARAATVSAFVSHRGPFSEETLYLAPTRLTDMRSSINLSLAMSDKVIIEWDHIGGDGS